MQQGRRKEDSEGSEESKGKLDRYSVRGDRNLHEQKQQQESIPAGDGSYLRETGKILNYPGQVWKMSSEEQEILSRWTEFSSKIMLNVILNRLDP